MQWPYSASVLQIALLAASEVTTASKQPQRSNLTSDLKSVTPITYLSMCMHIAFLVLALVCMYLPPHTHTPSLQLVDLI